MPEPQAVLIGRELIGVGPFLDRDTPQQIAERLGWQICEDEPVLIEGSVKFRHPSGTGGCHNTMWSDPDTATTALVSVHLGDVSPASGGALSRDRFAIAARELTAELGTPTTTEPGYWARVIWEIDEVTLTLSYTDAGPSLTAELTDDPEV